VAKSNEQKEAIARAYGEGKSSTAGVKSGASFRLNLSRQKRDSLERQKEELKKRLAALA
jgi:hypothetical protein